MCEVAAVLCVVVARTIRAGQCALPCAEQTEGSTQHQCYERFEQGPFPAADTGCVDRATQGWRDTGRQHTLCKAIFLAMPPLQEFCCGSIKVSIALSVEGVPFVIGPTCLCAQSALLACIGSWWTAAPPRRWSMSTDQGACMEPGENACSVKSRVDTLKDLPTSGMADLALGHH